MAAAKRGCRVLQAPPCRAALLLRLVLVLAAASRAAAQWASTVYAGSTNTSGHVDGALTAAATFSFSSGAGLAFAPNGTLYVADNPSFRVIDPGSATVCTLVTGGGFSAVCVNSASGAVYAFDYIGSPRALVQLYSNGVKRTITTGFYALACAVDGNGDIIVANTYTCVRPHSQRAAERRQARALTSRGVPPQLQLGAREPDYRRDHGAAERQQPAHGQRRRHGCVLARNFLRLGRAQQRRHHLVRLRRHRRLWHGRHPAAQRGHGRHVHVRVQLVIPLGARA